MAINMCQDPDIHLLLKVWFGNLAEKSCDNFGDCPVGEDSPVTASR